ncbi:MAG: hypothetical protein SFU27_11080 [Thermonemataceae bacterium]|nr:hypothetical protein [Thermonemataceae bacterium]
MKQVVIILFLLGFWEAQAQKSTEKKDVKATIERFFEGMKKSDTSLIRQTLYKNVFLQTTFIDKEQKARIITENIEDFLKSVATPHQVVYDEKILSYEIKIDQNLAMAWTEYEFFLGEKFSHCGVNVFILFQESPNNWKITQITDTRRKKPCKSAPK